MSGRQRQGISPGATRSRRRTVDLIPLRLRLCAPSPVIPGQPSSVALTGMPEPPPGRARPGPGPAIGVCGTDLEIYQEWRLRWTPPGQERLIIGHEIMGQVAEAAPGDALRPRGPAGRHRALPPRPRPACAAGTGTCAPTASTPSGESRPGTATPPSGTASTPTTWSPWTPRSGNSGVLLKPATVVAKAWDHIEKSAAGSSRVSPAKVLITGAGPIGLLAALAVSSCAHEHLRG